MDWMSTGKSPFNECLINGNIVPYDACSTKTLEESKNYYNKTIFTKYIGSGHVTYHDGVENNWEIEHHFFINPNKN